MMRTRTLITVTEHRSLFLPPFYRPRLPGHEDACSDQGAAHITASRLLHWQQSAEVRDVPKLRLRPPWVTSCHPLSEK